MCSIPTTIWEYGPGHQRRSATVGQYGCGLFEQAMRITPDQPAIATFNNFWTLGFVTQQEHWCPQRRTFFLKAAAVTDHELHRSQCIDHFGI